jgi:hypothetical protein
MPADVIDNTALSNFAQGQRPILLEQAFEDLVSVPAVIEELVIGQQRDGSTGADMLRSRKFATPHCSI